MDAIWSFWSQPYRTFYNQHWSGRRQYLASWVLSVMTCRAHFKQTALYTDEAGADLLIGRLGLPFDDVHLHLNQLRAEDAEWWPLGKLVAYENHPRPFAHIDNDVFMWRPLPRQVTRSAVFGQNMEELEGLISIVVAPTVYAELFELLGGHLPAAWGWAAAHGVDTMVNMGVFGGRDLTFIRSYARQARALATHPANQLVWNTLGCRRDHAMMVEQYLLQACLAYQEQRGDALQTAYLFDRGNACYGPDAARSVGYTHLLGDAKRDPTIGRWLDDYVRRRYPIEHARCAAAALV